MVALALVPLARLTATRLGYVSQPREDRWHRRPIALLGGVAIGLTVLVGVILFRVVHEISVLLACAALIFAAGLADDVKSLKPSTKLVVEIALASVLLFFRYRLNWTSSLTLDTLITLVWVVGMTNAFNLLDNMDGLCAGIALIVGGALLIGLHPAQADEAFFQARYLGLLLGATAAFLVYNFHPASIFMGDSGSLLLGFSMAAITLTHGDLGAAKSNPLPIVAVPLLVLLIPIFDTTLVTASRILSGRSPADGGRVNHRALYHRGRCEADHRYENQSLDAGTPAEWRARADYRVRQGCRDDRAEHGDHARVHRDRRRRFTRRPSNHPHARHRSYELQAKEFGLKAA